MKDSSTDRYMEIQAHRGKERDKEANVGARGVGSLSSSADRVDNTCT